MNDDDVVPGVVGFLVFQRADEVDPTDANPLSSLMLRLAIDALYDMENKAEQRPATLFRVERLATGVVTALVVRDETSGDIHDVRMTTVSPARVGRPPGRPRFAGGADAFGNVWVFILPGRCAVATCAAAETRA